MSWTDEELDDLVRNASKHVPNPVCQDEYFDELVHLLPQKKKNRWWLLAFSPALLLPLLFLNVEQAKLSSENYQKSLLHTKKMSYFTTVKAQNTSKVWNVYGKEQNHMFGKSLEIESKQVTLTEIQQKESSIVIKIDQFETSNTKEDHLAFKETVLVESTYNPILSALSINHKTKANYLSFNSQLGLSSSWIKETNAKPAFVIDFGVAYQRRFSSLSAELGLNFSAFIPQEMSFEKNSKVYGVKINRYQQQLTYHAIYALDLPLQISKSFHRNSLSLSVAPQYFFGGTVAVSQIRNDQQVNHDLYIGTKHGLNDFGLKGAIAYQYKLSNTCEFGVKISAQLINPLKDEVLGISKNNFPVMGQLTLKKYIKLR